MTCPSSTLLLVALLALSVQAQLADVPTIPTVPGVPTVPTSTASSATLPTTSATSATISTASSITLPTISSSSKATISASSTSSALLASTTVSSTSAAPSGTPGVDPTLVQECRSKVNQLAACLDATWNDSPSIKYDDAVKRLETSACSDDCWHARRWIWQTPSRATQCMDIVGIPSGDRLKITPAVLDQACLGVVPGEKNADGQYCHLLFKNTLATKGVSEEKFLADPSSLPKDQACTPCMKALSEYDKHMLQMLNGTSYTPTTTVLTATVAQATVTSSPMVWPQIKPAFPDDAAIDRIHAYCKWDETKANDQGESGAVEAATTKSVSLMVAVMAMVLAVAGMVPV
ncbi:hypothetical protein AMAG_08446 [Allomyces macrogynus ATCC 38327]|uniref:Uncharacterized protein n=1 Tax=Allomyces macrogynus (strain ATCC 38327) TaxID=578462 RepID=A0A0L0SL66_ALLM3|nr:hypothetical protein AMAG_08446 [Allomyces macrogynus ATCC 38327]|eukprot:KNE63306.1 hypothetical protein AMAG_08446 [Allomyces macrogynus ATCC 38327]